MLSTAQPLTCLLTRIPLCSCGQEPHLLGLHLRLPSREKPPVQSVPPELGQVSFLNVFVVPWVPTVGLIYHSECSFLFTDASLPLAHKLFGCILHFVLKYISREKHSARRSWDRHSLLPMPLLSPAAPVSDLRDQLWQLVFLPAPLPAVMWVCGPVLLQRL